MLKFLIQLFIMIIVMFITDNLIFRYIRWVDKKERKKIDSEELKVYNELRDIARELDKRERELREREKNVDNTSNITDN